MNEPKINNRLCLSNMFPFLDAKKNVIFAYSGLTITASWNFGELFAQSRRLKMKWPNSHCGSSNFSRTIDSEYFDDLKFNWWVLICSSIILEEIDYSSWPRSDLWFASYTRFAQAGLEKKSVAGKIERGVYFVTSPSSEFTWNRWNSSEFSVKFPKQINY